MKKLLLLGFLTVVNIAHSEIELVPLDMELGYWETNGEVLHSDAINKVLESVPEAQRAMMREMMGSKMKIPKSKQCITEASFKDLEKRMRESMGDQAAGQGCKFEVSNSSSKGYSGKLSCKGMETLVHTKAINSKRQETTVESTIVGVGASKLRLLTEWKAKICPEGL
ncbi:MAG: hypothetical protein ACI9GW_001036 [Halieaceae bacterium]